MWEPQEVRFHACRGAIFRGVALPGKLQLDLDQFLKRAKKIGIVLGGKKLFNSSLRIALPRRLKSPPRVLIYS